MAHDEQSIDLSRHLALEVDGPGVTPESIDAPLFLELAASFFQLVKANASEATIALELTGVQIIDKCVAAVARVNGVEIARLCAEQALRQIASEEDAPRGSATFAERARSAIRKLPEGQSVKVLAGSWARLVSVAQAREQAPLDSIISIRATPIRAGGKKPAVRFRSELEGDFTLSTTPEQTRALGGCLYEEVDIVALVSRDVDGNIESGDLESFDPLESIEPHAAWREWYRKVGGAEWDQIQDLKAELGR